MTAALRACAGTFRKTSSSLKRCFGAIFSCALSPGFGISSIFGKNSECKGMRVKVVQFCIIMIPLFFGMSCSTPQKKKAKVKANTTVVKKAVKPKKKAILLEEPQMVLNEKNAIPFLFEYQQQC